MGQNKWRYSKKIHIWNRVRLSLRGKKIFVNQTLFYKFWYIDQIYTIPKYITKDIEKRMCDILWNRKKIQPSRHLAKLCIWRDGLGTFDTDAQLHYIKMKRIQRLLNPPMLSGKISYWSEFWSRSSLFFDKKISLQVY